jgi:hypothetical protein
MDQKATFPQLSGMSALAPKQFGVPWIVRLFGSDAALKEAI